MSDCRTKTLDFTEHIRLNFEGKSDVMCHWKIFFSVSLRHLLVENVNHLVISNFLFTVCRRRLTSAEDSSLLDGIEFVQAIGIFSVFLTFLDVLGEKCCILLMSLNI